MRLPSPILKLLRRCVLHYMAVHHRDVLIYQRESKYVERWYVHPKSQRKTDPNNTAYVHSRGNLFGIYIHRFLASDEDEAKHDHPRHNISIVIDRGFWEHIKGRRVWRAPGTIVFRRATTPHRIELEFSSGVPRHSHEAISLFITGPRIREWGYHCAGGWVPWQTFHHGRDSGTTTGCPK